MGRVKRLEESCGRKAGEGEGGGGRPGEGGGQAGEAGRRRQHQDEVGLGQRQHHRVGQSGAQAVEQQVRATATFSNMPNVLEKLLYTKYVGQEYGTGIMIIAQSLV